MSTIVLSLPPLLLVTGALYALLALSVWALLPHRHPVLPATLWSTGGVAGGAGIVLLALHTLRPDATGVHLANGLLAVMVTLRILALRCDLRRPLLPGGGVLLWGAVVLGYGLSSLWHNPALRSAYAAAMLGAGSAVLAGHAAMAARHTGSRSALVLAWTEGLLAATMAIRALTLLTGTTAPLGRDVGGDVIVLMFIAIATSMYSHVGYLGMVLDRTRAGQDRAREAQWAESTRREAAEQQATELQNLLRQRDQLAAERQQLLQVLAHEIRQPLHNASGALQAATAVLQSPQVERSTALVTERLLRAQAVLGDVQSVLDNTLAAATLLSRREPLSRQNVDVDFLIDLALGDLGEAQRARVRTDWQASLRSVDVEPGLVRLALRNLLRNAFSHGGRDVRVTLRIQEQPGALVLSVIDSGLGMPPARLQAANDTQEPGPSPLAVGGLGLYIVRRVMALHNGRLVLAGNMPQGLIAQLVFPRLHTGSTVAAVSAAAA